MPSPLAAPLPKVEESEGMRIIRVRSWPQERDYYLAPEIYSIIQQGHWDLIHCQGCHTCVPPLTMIAAQRARIPYVVTFHTGGNSSRFRTMFRGTYWKVLRPLFAHSAKLIGVSRLESDFFRDHLRLPARQFTVIPNGVTLPELPVADPPELEIASAEVSHHPLILSVGRLERFKGHQRMIYALPRIRERYPDAQLLILGVGPYEETLRQVARTMGVAAQVTIRAVPISDRQAMARLLSKASLVTLLSEQEGHPIAVLEALALKRPVLVARAPGLQALADEGLVRSIPLSSTPEEVAAAAIEQIEHPLIPEHVVLPTWDHCAQQLHLVYEECVRKKLCA